MAGTERLPCPETTTGLLSGHRVAHCQGQAGHTGKCTYHYRGSQGGTLYSWWGVNPKPIGYVEDLSPNEWRMEIWRLRDLCDQNDIDWKAGLL